MWSILLFYLIWIYWIHNSCNSIYVFRIPIFYIWCSVLTICIFQFHCKPEKQTIIYLLGGDCKERKMMTIHEMPWLIFYCTYILSILIRSICTCFRLSIDMNRWMNEWNETEFSYYYFFLMSTIAISSGPTVSEISSVRPANFFSLLFK